jgi:hypothetical protein
MGGTASNFASASEYSNFFSQVEQTCTSVQASKQTILAPVTLNNCKDVQITLKNTSGYRFQCDENSRLNAQQSNMVSMNQSAKAGWFGNANNTSISDTVNNVEAYVNQNCNSVNSQQQVIDTAITCNNTVGFVLNEMNNTTSSTVCALLSDQTVVQANSTSITQKAAGVDPGSILMILVWIVLAIVVVAIGVPMLVSALGKSAKTLASDVGSSVTNIAGNAGSAASKLLKGGK